MAERKDRKRSFILISSSSSEEEKEKEKEEDEPSQNESEFEPQDEDEQSQQESESESVGNDDDDDDYIVEGDEDIVHVISDSTSRDENESDDEDYNSNPSPMEAKSINEKVEGLLQGRRDLQQKLSLTECKTYLRNHGLRLSGTKAECIERMKEHWRIKDGNAEAIYPRSSFNINCTGDVCKGDVVLFSQKVYEKFDKVSRTGNLLGKRTIAGRIVKESYGAARQQHTFTVEVLWSKGLKKLSPLFPLLVKGRNLYKLKTYRQRWKNEPERSLVLDEKHKRGTAARLMRAMKKSKNTSRTNTGSKRQIDFNQNPSRKKQRIELNKGKHVDRLKQRTRTEHDKGKSIYKCKKSPVRKSHDQQRHHKTHKISNQNLKQQKDFTHPNEYHRFPSHSYATSDIHHHRPPLSFPPYMMAPQYRPYANPYSVPLNEPRDFYRGVYPHHTYTGSAYECEPRNLDSFSRSVNGNRPLHPFPVRRGGPELNSYRFL